VTTEAARLANARQAVAKDEQQYRQWYNSPEGKRQYIRKAAANGATSFDPAKYELATSTSPDLENIKKQALAQVGALFQKEKPMNQDELKILARIANALEAIAQASAPAAPNYQFPFEEYSGFDWSRINATVIATDEYGATAVNWNGHTWKRRSWPQKYGLVVGFTRPDGMGEDGVNWLNLIAFKEMKPVEPLDEKVTKALAGQRRPAATNGNGRKAKPGTWDHVEEGGATNGRTADLRASLEEIKGLTLGDVAEKAANTNRYTHANHAMNAMKEYKFPAGVRIIKSQKVSQDGALKVFDWLMGRKAAAAVDEANGTLFAD
jgi:hypothetical protein